MAGHQLCVKTEGWGSEGRGGRGQSPGTAEEEHGGTGKVLITSNEHDWGRTIV